MAYLRMRKWASDNQREEDGRQQTNDWQNRTGSEIVIDEDKLIDLNKLRRSTDLPVWCKPDVAKEHPVAFATGRLMGGGLSGGILGCIAYALRNEKKRPKKSTSYLLGGALAGMGLEGVLMALESRNRQR